MGMKMKAEERREQIISILKSNETPISATALAKELNVSRQIIVGDIALLRAAGTEISATPRGYILSGNDTKDRGVVKTVVCRHNGLNMKEELYAVVDNGGGLMDVIVEHSVYGQITGQLHIFSRADADLFLFKINENKALPLSNLTNGIHLHTICARTDADMERILNALSDNGILYER